MATANEKELSPEDQVRMLRNALMAYEGVREQLFGHCCSNGIFNAWGEQFDCTTLNNAHQLAEKVLEATKP